MKPYTIKLAQILTYSGTIPFIASLLIKYIPLAHQDLLFISLTYGAIIISFLCGIHWAIYLFYYEKSPFNLLIISNIITLTAWGSLMVKFVQASLLVQTCCFVILLYIDSKLSKTDILPLWFYDLRKKATVIVVLCLLGVAINCH